MTVVDVHAHCIPRAMLDRLETDGAGLGIEVETDASGTTVGLPNGRRLGPLRKDLIDTAMRIDAMDRAGIDVQLLSSWIDLTAYSVADGGRYARMLNDSLAEEAASHSERLTAICTVPLQQPETAAAELEHAMTTLGMAGVEIATRVEDVPLEEAGLDVFWATAERLGAFVLLHPMDPLPGVDLKRRFMHNMIGRPAETTIAVAGLIFGGVLERFPDLIVCAVHGGGFAPFQIGRMDRGYAEKPKLTAQHITEPPSTLLRRMYVDTVVHEPAVLRFLVEWFGADRILLGTDFPFEMGDDDPVGFVERAGLPAEAVDSILRGNAARLLGARSTA